MFNVRFGPGAFCLRSACSLSIDWAAPHRRAGIIETGGSSLARCGGTLLGVLDLFSVATSVRFDLRAWRNALHHRFHHSSAHDLVSPALKSCRKRARWAGRKSIMDRYLTVGLAAFKTSFVAHWLQVTSRRADVGLSVNDCATLTTAPSL